MLGKYIQGNKFSNAIDMEGEINVYESNDPQ